MDWSLIVSVISAVVSFFGAYLSFRQSREAAKAKDASEAARQATEDAKAKFFHNIQYEDFTSFKKDVDKFVQTLIKASSGKNGQGRKRTYINDELETFLSKLNSTISNASNTDRQTLEAHYECLKQRRNTLVMDDRTTIIVVLDEMRELSRCIADIQMNSKLNV